MFMFTAAGYLKIYLPKRKQKLAVQEVKEMTHKKNIALTIC